MEWYSTSVSAGPTYGVLLDRIATEVALARQAGQLPDTAQIYALPIGDVMQLFVNEPARMNIHAVNLLALLPGSEPSPHHAVALITP